MSHLRLTLSQIATSIAGIIILASVAGTILYNFLNGHSLPISRSSKALALACNSQSQNDNKIYFVSCGGTF